MSILFRTIMTLVLVLMFFMNISALFWPKAFSPSSAVGLVLLVPTLLALYQLYNPKANSKILLFLIFDLVIFSTISFIFRLRKYPDIIYIIATIIMIFVIAHVIIISIKSALKS